MEDSGNLSLCVCNPSNEKQLVEMEIPKAALILTEICPEDKVFVVGKDDFLVFLMEKGDVYGSD